MPHQFTAKELSISEKDWGLLTVLSAPSTEDEDFYLMFQSANAYDEQDIRLGMDKPYIEYCGQGWSWYGHMLRVELLADKICIQMDSEAAAEMEGDGEIVVSFEFPAPSRTELRTALDRTFSGLSMYSVAC